MCHRGGGNRRRAFTLAEVLITLGIIGVVAALTLPVLISKYKHKELETRFKKAYSVLSQATVDLPTEYGRCEVANASEINDFVFNKLKKIGSGSLEMSNIGYIKGFKTYTLEDTDAVIHPNCFSPWKNQKWSNYIIMPDGTTFSFCTNNTVGSSISVDTNGGNKGPNAYGHDLFFFHIVIEDCKLTHWNHQWRSCYEGEDGCADGDGKTEFGFKWTNGACSRDSKAVENGFVCTKYAVANFCPDDSSKNYWECLP